MSSILCPSCGKSKPPQDICRGCETFVCVECLPDISDFCERCNTEGEDQVKAIERESISQQITVLQRQLKAVK